MNTLKEAALSALILALPVITAALVALVLAVLEALRKKLIAQKDSTVLVRVSDRVLLLAKGVVHDVEMEMRPHFAEATADGVLTPEERTALRLRALAVLKERMGTRGMAELEDALKAEAGAIGGILASLIGDLMAGMEERRATALVHAAQAEALSPLRLMPAAG